MEASISAANAAEVAHWHDYLELVQPLLVVAHKLAEELGPGQCKHTAVGVLAEGVLEELYGCTHLVEFEQLVHCCSDWDGRHCLKQELEIEYTAVVEVVVVHGDAGGDH